MPHSYEVYNICMYVECGANENCRLRLQTLAIVEKSSTRVTAKDDLLVARIRFSYKWTSRSDIKKKETTDANASPFDVQEKICDILLAANP